VGTVFPFELKLSYDYFQALRMTQYAICLHEKKSPHNNTTTVKQNEKDTTAPH
jgi:hypothetical protein